MVHARTSYFYSIFFVGWTNFLDWLNFRKRLWQCGTKSGRTRPTNRNFKVGGGDHYGQRLYDKWLIEEKQALLAFGSSLLIWNSYLPISRICLQYLEVVGTVGVFKNYQAQPYNHYGFKAKDGIGLSILKYNQWRTPTTIWSIHSAKVREISFLPSKTCIISGCNSK